MAKVTLKQNGDIEVKAGAFCPRVVGTWHYKDVWAENGGRRDKSGNLLVRGYWVANLKGYDATLVEYTRKDLVELIKSKV